MIKFIKSPVILSTLLCAVLLYFGIVKISEKHSLHSLLNPSEITKVSGKLENSPSLLSNKKYYCGQLKVQEVWNKSESRSSAKGKIKVFIPEQIVNVYLPGKLYTKNTGSKGALFEEEGTYLFSGKFSGDIFYVEKLISSYWNESFLGKIYFLRAKGRVYFKRLMYSWKNAGGLFLALLSGSREYTENGIAESFRLAGLSHILALSGMHLSLLSGIAVFIGNKTKRIRVAYLIRLTALILFVWFAGFSPSLTRAFICCLILILSSLVNIEKPDMLFVLCISFIIQTNLTPDEVSNAGFLLSYGALFGILILKNLVSKIYYPFLPLKTADSLTASTSAQIFTAPVSLYLFKAFYPVGIISSVIVSPLITFFIYAGLILFLISLIIPFFSGISGIFMNLIYTVITFFVKIFASFPGITIS